jgi:hypothetical protein
MSRAWKYMYRTLQGAFEELMEGWAWKNKGPSNVAVVAVSAEMQQDLN